MDLGSMLASFWVALGTILGAFWGTGAKVKMELLLQRELTGRSKIVTFSVHFLGWLRGRTFSYLLSILGSFWEPFGGLGPLLFDPIFSPFLGYPLEAFWEPKPLQHGKGACL